MAAAPAPPKSLVPPPRAAGACVLLPLAAACVVVSPGQEPATPQRPTVSSNTQTTAEDTFELEGGMTFDPADRFELPATLKWGAGPATELFASFSPYLDVDEGPVDADGIGDLAFGVRQRVLEETPEAPSAALQLTTKLPTADDGKGLGSGELDFLAAAIASKRVRELYLTGFYQLGVVGSPGPGTDVQHLLALAADRTLRDDLTAFGELAWVVDGEVGQEPVFTTLGLALTAGASRVFDVGVVVGLNGDAPDFQIVAGFTQNLGSARAAGRY